MMFHRVFTLSFLFYDSRNTTAVHHHHRHLLYRHFISKKDIHMPTTDARVVGTATDAVAVAAGGDQYETMPCDLEYMLQTYCCKQHSVIWEPFTSAHGFSARYMRHLGYRVIESPAGADFFAYDEPPTGATIVISNPPFSLKQQVLKRLVVQFGLPCCLLLPIDVIQRDYFSAIVRSASQQSRFFCTIPNKTVRFHYGGVLQPLARFKSAFFMFQPNVVTEREDEVCINSCEQCRAVRLQTTAALTMSTASTIVAATATDLRAGLGAVGAAPATSTTANALSRVTITLFDYDAMQRKRRDDVVCKEIFTSGARIGKRKR
jgi:hypothetical protein